MKLRWLMILAASAAWAAGPVHKDLVYGEASGVQLKLDLYLPDPGSKPAPLLVWVHGGGWRAGSKDQTPARWLVEKGFAVASVGYRLSGVAKFPAQIVDCQNAVRWLRAHAGEYGYDPRKVAAWGASAGGHLVALLGVMKGDAQVQAVVDYFGPTDLLQMSKFPSKIPHDAPDSPESLLIGGPIQENKEKTQRANPLRYVSAESAPFLIVHGDQDPLVPLNQSELLRDALTAAKVPVKMHVIQGGGHGGAGVSSAGGAGDGAGVSRKEPEAEMKLTRRETLAMLGAAAPLGAWQSFYYGADAPLARPVELRAGELTMQFEPALGFLRYIRFGDVEVVRGIYAAVRDRNWGTVTPRLSKLRVESSGDAFRVTFDVECKDGAIDFFWRGTIEGKATSEVTFRMQGEARSTFLRNRLGFCVLHPLEGCAGRACTVRHSDGKVEKGTFPQAVAPNQPFIDMTAITHEVGGGAAAEVAFEGEVFEMEDHRNWTDASYKTYCTPLGKPYPVEVKQGSAVTQAVTVRLHGAPRRGAAAFQVHRKEITLEPLSGQVRALPRIGVEATGDALTAREIGLLKGVGLAHVRVDSRRDASLAQGKALGLPLEVAVFLGSNPEEQLRALREKLSGAAVARYVIFHEAEKSTQAKWVELARRTLRGAPVGGGTNAYFAELNRERPSMEPLDFVGFSLNPQVHAFDNASLAENLAAQADALDSARRFAAGKGIVVSPVTLKPRFNPNATAETKVDANVFPVTADARQLSLFGAAWTLGSIKYLAESGAQSVTYYETAGVQGLIERESGTRWPREFPSRPGQAFPLYHVLSEVQRFAGGEVLRARSSAPLAVDGLMLRKGNTWGVLVGNLTAEAQAVRFTWPGAEKRISIRKLDGYSQRQAAESPQSWRTAPGDLVQLKSGVVEVTLGAFATAFVASA